MTTQNQAHGGHHEQGGQEVAFLEGQGVGLGHAPSCSGSRSRPRPETRVRGRVHEKRARGARRLPAGSRPGRSVTC